MSSKSSDSAVRPFRPRRLASWWSRLPALQCPEPLVRDAIRRRADALAEAGVDTAVQFGFHYRFDFAPYFGLLHGYLAEVAEQLHQRGIRFLDHYSCNVIGRPKSREELEKYHTFQRHCVTVHPDALAADTFAYAGFRLNDLREVDVETGAPTYTWGYQGDLLCHSNPDFRAMHAAYLRRHMAEIPADGFEVDDMARYAYFRACACRHCRERFVRDYGRELPQFSDKSFWGDTSKPESEWGNYDNPAFRDWVQMRYRTHADHLAQIRQTIGPERILMTCCASSGPSSLNAFGLSYEHFMPVCDWVMLENCGLGPATVDWARMEPEAMLHRAVAATKAPDKPAPTVALSYALFDDGAQLGGAIARFWGARNWISTVLQGLIEDPDDFKEEAELIAPFNRWELAHELPEGSDVAEVRVVFLRAAKEDGWRDEQGRDHWARVTRWAQALSKADIGYRFLLTDELADARRLAAENTTLILVACPTLSASQRDAVTGFAHAGGRLIVESPVDVELIGSNVVTLDADTGPAALPELLAKGLVTPRLQRVSGGANWRLRLRVHGDKLVLHVLNGALEGIAHPTVLDRFCHTKVLQSIRATAAKEPLVVEIETGGLPTMDVNSLALSGPELPDSRPVRAERVKPTRLRLTLDLRGIRIYAQAAEKAI